MLFQNQTLASVILDTEYDISGATVLKIKYKKPNGVSGEWTGTLNGQKIVYDVVSENDLNVSGRWELQAFATIGGKNIYGESTQMEIYPHI